MTEKGFGESDEHLITENPPPDGFYFTTIYLAGAVKLLIDSDTHNVISGSFDGNAIDVSG